MKLTSTVLVGVVAMPLCGAITLVHAQTGRDLVCRGGSSGLEFRVVADPSPKSTATRKLVRMSLRYRTSPYGLTRTTLAPGSCGWPGSDKPPGEVLFDETPNAQELQKRQGVPIDTSVNAAEVYEDTASIRRYMSVPNHFWRFLYYEEKDGLPLSGSHGSLPALTPEVPTATRPNVAAATGINPLAKTGMIAKTAKPPGAGPPGRHLKTADELRRTPLQFVGIDRLLDTFKIKFIARPGAVPTVLYSLDEPIREPSTGLWFFNHGVVQGSGAVEGGFRAEVREVNVPLAGSNYTATNRLPIERGKTYHYIISVPRSPELPEQQLTGQFTAMRRDVRVTITDIKIVSSTIPSADVKWDYWIGYPNAQKEGANTLENAPDRIRLFIGAFRGGKADGGLIGGRFLEPNLPGDWTAVPGKNTGVAKEEFDLARNRFASTGSSSGDYTTTVIVHSLPGDIVFEATAKIEVFRR